MTWDNYGAYVVNGPRTWVVDHIVPCASFDMSKPEQQRECFNYKNLQPLCSVENNVKSDRLDYPQKKAVTK
jgi:5-methylcytosine-specific restriction endonuclease McrA